MASSMYEHQSSTPQPNDHFKAEAKVTPWSIKPSSAIAHLEYSPDKRESSKMGSGLFYN